MGPLLDVLHLLARSAVKTLIHHDIQRVPGSPATNLATSYLAPAPWESALASANNCGVSELLQDSRALTLRATLCPKIAARNQRGVHFDGASGVENRRRNDCATFCEDLRQVLATLAAPVFK